MPETLKSQKSGTVLDNLFGTPEEIEAESRANWERAQAEREEKATEVTVTLVHADTNNLLNIEDTWDESSPNLEVILPSVIGLQLEDEAQ